MKLWALPALFVTLVGCRGMSVDTWSVPDDGTPPARISEVNVQQGATARFAFLLEHTETMDGSATHYYTAYADSDDPKLATVTRTAATIAGPRDTSPVSVWDVRGLAVGTTFLRIFELGNDDEHDVVVHVLP